MLAWIQSRCMGSCWSVAKALRHPYAHNYNNPLSGAFSSTALVTYWGSCGILGCTKQLSALVFEPYLPSELDDAGGPYLSVDASKPWDCIGANCYYMLSHCAEYSRRAGICSLLDSLSSSGFNAIRTWAFNDGQDQWHALQTAPGVYDTKVLEGLDWLVCQCKQRGLRLLLVLTNYWQHYGGILQYVRWSRMHHGACPSSIEPDEFYMDARAQALLMAHISYMLARTNIFTGIKYTDEPTIMAWELINEPRCKADGTVCPSAMHSWLRTAAQQLKQLAPRQLVTIGCEGFWGNSTPEMMQYNPYENQAHGCDFALEAAIPAVDFTSIHMYPDHWLPAGSQRTDVLSWTHDWLRSHAQYSRQLGRPLLLTEFGSHAVVCVPAEQQTSASGPSSSAAAVQPSSQPPSDSAIQSSTGIGRWCGLACSVLEQMLTACVVKPAGSFECKDAVPSQHVQQQQQQSLSGGPYLLRHEYIDAVLDMCFSPQHQVQPWPSPAGLPLRAHRRTGLEDTQHAPGGAHIRAPCDVAGAFVWMVAEPDYADYDGFTIYDPHAVHKHYQQQQGEGHQQQGLGVGVGSEQHAAVGTGEPAGADEEVHVGQEGVVGHDVHTWRSLQAFVKGRSASATQ